MGKAQQKKLKQHPSRYVNLIRTAMTASASRRYEVKEQAEFETRVSGDLANPRCGVLGIRDFVISSPEEIRQQCLKSESP